MVFCNFLDGSCEFIKIQACNTTRTTFLVLPHFPLDAGIQTGLQCFLCPQIMKMILMRNRLIDQVHFIAFHLRNSAVQWQPLGFACLCFYQNRIELAYIVVLGFFVYVGLVPATEPLEFQFVGFQKNRKRFKVVQAGFESRFPLRQCILLIRVLCCGDAFFNGKQTCFCCLHCVIECLFQLVQGHFFCVHCRAGYFFSCDGHTEKRAVNSIRCFFCVVVIAAHRSAFF